MQHLTLTTAAGGALPLAVPTSWADVTLGDYIRLLQQPAAPPATVLCPDLDEAALHAVAAQDAVYLSACLAFLAADPADSCPAPSPELADVGAAPYGQLLLGLQFVDQHPDEPALFHAPYLYAVYESHRRWGEKNSAERLDGLYRDTLARPLPEVYADVVFTLGGWLNFTNATPPAPTTPPSPTTTNSTRASKPSAPASAPS